MKLLVDNQSNEKFENNEIYIHILPGCVYTLLNFLHIL